MALTSFLQGESTMYDSKEFIQKSLGLEDNPKDNIAFELLGLKFQFRMYMTIGHRTPKTKEMGSLFLDSILDNKLVKPSFLNIIGSGLLHTLYKLAFIIKF